MQFNERVTHLLDKPRDGSKERLSLAGYAELSEERKRYYGPIYAKYRTKKVRAYDPDCGHFTGWEPVQIGIGDPIAYKHIGYWAARFVDTMLESNVLMKRMLNKKA